MHETIWIGFDSREVPAYAVAINSIRRHLTRKIPIHGLVLNELQRSGIYKRPTSATLDLKGNRHLTDKLSVREGYNGAMSTEFAISRFLVPILAGREGWAIFADSDILARGDLSMMFGLRDESKAVQVVKHDYTPRDTVKMDGQPQAAYSRKNWSSVMLFNLGHPANKAVTLEMVNSLPGRDLHNFCWLKDEEIGELGLEWNWLVDESPPLEDPRIVHHTLGSPCLPGYEGVPYAGEWRASLREWASVP